MGQNNIVHMPLAVLNLATGVGTSVGTGWIEHTGKFNDGPFAGRPVTEVVAEAIDWWQKYLDDVDNAAKSFDS